MLVVLAILAGCSEPDPVKKPDPEPVDTDSGTAPVDTHDTDTTETAVVHTGDTAPALDCSILPPTPAPYQTTTGWPTAEDFDFDGDGYFVAVNDNNLIGRNQAGEIKIVSPNLSTSTAGTRILPSGDWVVNDVGNGGLIRVEAATGAKVTVASGFAYPNGLEVGRDGYAFVAEQSGGRLNQIDPYTGERWIVAEGLSNPNGVILSADEQIIYTASFGNGILYAVDRIGPTEWDTPRIVRDDWPKGITGSFDGINTDVCGNVYLTEFGAGIVLRVTPDGAQVHMVADPPSGWIPNMRWGHGLGGWDTATLYVTSIGGGDVYALDMQIEGKKHVLIP